MERKQPEIDLEETMTPEDLAEKYSKELAKFFEIEELKLELKQYESAEELKKAYKEFYGEVPETLSTGFVSPGQTHILIKDYFPKGPMGEDPAENYRKVLKHETTHHYVNALNESVPNWLNEGTCLSLAGQEKPEPVHFTVTDLVYSDQNGDAVFVFGKAIVKRVMKEFGKQKLFELIKTRKPEEIYDELQRMFPWLK